MTAEIAPPGFALDPAFEAGSAPLASLLLCAVRLQLDARFPWLILIPRLAGAVEIEDLATGDRVLLIEEVILAGQAVRAVGEAMDRPVFKLNVGALGNVTPQLHIHVVGRRPDDAAWPGPVWGAGVALDFGAEPLATVRAAALAGLTGVRRDA
jgi:diadenosine tetraphosphate (Ap4A) HIT family hydrolase